MKSWIVAVTFLLAACVNADTTDNVSDADICQILQLTLNLPMLQQYYHVDKKPQRKPLRLVFSDRTLSCQSVIKFGSPVIIRATFNNKYTYLQINKINFHSNNSEVEFEYKDEGIKGKALFQITKRKWKFISGKIVEM